MGVIGLLKAVDLSLLFSIIFILGESMYKYSVLKNPLTLVCYKKVLETSTLDFQGPIFVNEPAYNVEFSNNTGGQVHCSGHANPYPEVMKVFFSLNIF